MKITLKQNPTCGLLWTFRDVPRSLHKLGLGKMSTVTETEGFLTSIVIRNYSHWERIKKRFHALVLNIPKIRIESDGVITTNIETRMEFQPEILFMGDPIGFGKGRLVFSVKGIETHHSREREMDPTKSTDRYEFFKPASITRSWIIIPVYMDIMG